MKNRAAGYFAAFIAAAAMTPSVGADAVIEVYNNGYDTPVVYAEGDSPYDTADTPVMVEYNGYDTPVVYADEHPGMLFIGGEEYSPLADCIEIHSALTDSDIENIGRLTPSGRLVIRFFSKPCDADMIKKLCSLKNLQECSELSLIFGYGTAAPDAHRSYKYFSKLKGLTELELYICDSVSGLSGMNRLKQLSLICQGKKTIDLTSVGTLKSLEKLHISNANLKNIDKFCERAAKSGKMKELGLYYCSISDMSSISMLTSLRRLYIDNGEEKRYRAENVQCLKNLRRLERLRLNYCGITDISFLRKMKNLKILNLYGNNITDVSVLIRLHKLEEIMLYSNPLENDTHMIKRIIWENPDLKLIYTEGRRIDMTELENKYTHLDFLNVPPYTCIE